MPTQPVTIQGIMTTQDLGIWGPTDPRPTHPIANPPDSVVIPPDGIAPGVPTHPIYLPVYPAHPIVIPPDGIAPGVPTHPIYIPVYPAHPIVIPPDAIEPGVPTHPIYLPPGIWGPTDPRPSNPIANVPGISNPNPPDYPHYPGQPPTALPPAVNVPVNGKLVFIPGVGWIFVPDAAGGGEPEGK